jgi:hypothetical protein
MKVVAISGWVKSGKDTAAAILISDYGFKRIAFADPLKNSVSEDFSISRESLDSQVEKELPILSMPVDPKDAFSKTISEFLVREFRTDDNKRCESFVYAGDTRFCGIHPDTNALVSLYWTRRALCILEGSSKRTADPNFWVKKAIETARAQNIEYVVISDLRYKNELSALREALGPNDSMSSVRISRFETSPSTDPSERDLDDAEFDVHIHNKKTLEEFKLAVHLLGGWATKPEPEQISYT